MTDADPPAARRERFHFLDVARALLMLLGIPFHAALVYAHTSWIVDSPDTLPGLAWFPTALSTFRMPGFFVIAGFFAAMILQRRPARAWLRSRVVRLGLPLLTGAAVIVPLQNLMLHDGPAGAARLPVLAGPLILSHLWFLPVLLILSAMLALGWSRLSRLHWPDLPVWAIGLICALWNLALRAEYTFPGWKLTLLDGLLDLEAVLIYAPFFLLGAVARCNPATFARLRTWSWPTAALGLAAAVAYVATYHAQDRPHIVIEVMSAGFAAVCISQALLALLARIADRAIPAVDRLVDASFSIYLFHHPIIIALALMLVPVRFPPLVEWIAICLATLALSYGLHRLLRRSTLLLFLFNGVPPRRPWDASAKGISARLPS